MPFARGRFRLFPALAGVLVVFAGAAPPLAAADRAGERNAFRAALAAAARGADSDWRKLAAAVDSDYPPYPYIELAALRSDLKHASPEAVERFLARWPDTLAAADLRSAWLRELARRGDWPRVRATYAGSEERDLQCHALQARRVAGETLDFARDLEPVWQGSQRLPDACAAVIADARASGLIDDAQAWARLARAAEAGQADAVAQVAGWIDGTVRVEADRVLAALRDAPASFAKAKTWPDTPRTRDALAWGLARHARRDSAAAEAAWADLAARFKWDAAQKNRILNAIALYRATSYSPDALARLKALPQEADDDATREWRVRGALASADYAGTLEALERMSDGQKADPQWRYLRGRMLMKLGRDAEATALLGEVAREATFHGFLAADWVGRPYSICPDTLAADAQATARLERQADLARAFEFRELGMLREGRREWDFAMAKLEPAQQRLAADLAYRRGWYDRAVFAFSAAPETRRLYEQRFPVAMEHQVRRDAREAGIDPAWAYAIIRAESAWMADARSHADAYGLMQLLPAVGKQVAKSADVAWRGVNGLFDPEYNVKLGTRFLGQMAREFDGNPWLASAAYNAGARPVRRWLEARATLEPDFFIETIPYRETREYVARVLAFAVIYDWRLNDQVLPLSSRMPRVGQATRAANPSTPRKRVVCEAGPAAPSPSGATASGER